MGVWKKLNTETNTYEVIPNSGNSSGGSIEGISIVSTENCTNNYITKQISEVATNIQADTQADGSSKSGYTRYTLTNLKKGTILRVVVGWNADNAIFFYDGSNSLNNSSVLSNYNNTVYCRDLTLTQDYDTFYVATQTSKTTEHPNYCIIIYIPTKYQEYPQYRGSFIPTVGDVINDVEVLSNAQLMQYLGYDITGAKAKANLEGGVWIGFGDSYTVYADSLFREVAGKYGMIYDGQGKVSSTVCGDASGNKGFSPFWSRMDNFIASYTGDGQTIDDVVYTADQVKLITFMGGANDGAGTDTWLGKPFSKNTNYIYGSLNYMFNKLIENFPNATIIVILQPANYHNKVSSITTDEDAQKVGLTDLAELQAFSDYEYSQYLMFRKEKAVKECAERFGLPIVDCIFDWYNVINPTHRNLYWNTDEIHLTDLGSKKLAEKLEKKMREIFG